jgi:UDP-N-acetylglucosamine 2-epimerase (non-hydrolysing)
MRIVSVIGTRPEAIKMAPVLRALSHTKGVESIVCITGQHRYMLEQVLTLFEIRADHDLDVMVEGQTLNGLSARILERLDPVLDHVRPQRVLVHGDTSTAMAAALAAFHRKIPVGHVEAGLRTGSLAEPWPEEFNRRMVDVIGDYLFAPTEQARDNLLAERLSGQIHVTGNTVIDALQVVADQLDQHPALREQIDGRLPRLAPDARMVLVTSHRRENFGKGLEDICEALLAIAQHADAEVVYPVHLNPQVRVPVERMLGGVPRIHLIAPQDYLGFVRLMQRASVVLTDSGGVQEEAPSLGKPVLVMRDVTERPEAVRAGTVRLVGTHAEAIRSQVALLLDDAGEYERMARRTNPYGDGRASERIVAALCGRPVEPFVDRSALD